MATMASYQVSSQLAFWFRKRSEYIFLRWLPFWISDWKDFAIFALQVIPMLLLPSFEPTDLLGQEKKRNIDGSHLGFPIRMILAIFDLQVTQMLPTKFRVNWLFGSGEEVKNRVTRWPPWWPSWISNRSDFSYF